MGIGIDTGHDALSKMLGDSLKSPVLSATNILGARQGTEYACDGVVRLYQTRTAAELEVTKYDGNGNFQFRAPAPHPSLDQMLQNGGGNDQVLDFLHQAFPEEELTKPKVREPRVELQPDGRTGRANRK